MLNYLKYFNLGIMMVAPAIVGLLIGLGLDNIFRAFPIYTMCGLLLGIISGLWSMYKALKTLV